MHKGHIVRTGVLAGLWLVAAAVWADPTFTVSLDTSSISGTTEQLVFELIDGDGVVDNSVVLSSFGFGGGTIAGAADYLGTTGVSGHLGASISMDDSGGVALFAQPVTFGSSLVFTLRTTDNYSGTVAPDAFSMALYRPDFSACLSDDPVRCALLQLDVTGGTLTPSSFTLNGASAQSLPAPIVRFAGAAPEPGSLLLLTTGAVMLALRRRKDRSRVKPSIG